MDLKDVGYGEGNALAKLLPGDMKFTSVGQSNISSAGIVIKIGNIITGTEYKAVNSKINRRSGIPVKPLQTLVRKSSGIGRITYTAFKFFHIC